MRISDKDIHYIVSECVKRIKSEIISNNLNEYISHKIAGNVISLLKERIEQRGGLPTKEVQEGNEPPEEYVVGGGKDNIHIFKLANIYTDENGNTFLSPLYINNGSKGSPSERWYPNKWYEAGIGPHKVEIDDNTGEIIRYLKVDSSLSNRLSFRPGLHSGDMPYAPHIYTKKSNYGDKDLDGYVNIGEYTTNDKGQKIAIKKPGQGKMKYDSITDKDERRAYRDTFPFYKTRMQPKGTAWAEILVTYSKDDQSQVGKNGMQTLPKYGYNWKTNTSASSEATWYISRYMKIVCILTDEQVKQICASKNVVALDKDGSDIMATPKKK